ncbi:MAG: type II toxin-antitoxin system RelE/ParE family toxin [Gemmatimonadetes bacterium]|nr:type II toxin-antitoxin system RelE/ParE family toxin [Gemmatimonadota bacterium]
MASYKIQIKPSAVREIEAIPQKKQRQRIIARIRAATDNPRPRGVEKLSGLDRYRVRQGAYRIIYSIEDDALIVYVVKVGHRSTIYR